MEANKSYPSLMIRIETPEGRLFATIVEENGLPIEVFLTIGKTGTAVNAWAAATARLITRLLPNNGIYSVIEELLGITTNRTRALPSGVVCRSVPEGIAQALLKYRAIWFELNRAKPKEGGATRE